MVADVLATKFGSNTLVCIDVKLMGEPVNTMADDNLGSCITSSAAAMILTAIKPLI